MKRKTIHALLSSVLAASVLFTGIPYSVQAETVQSEATAYAVTAENVNHAATATMSASSVEDDLARLAADKANDGDSATRWASNYDEPSTHWLKAEFSDVTKIQQIKLEFFTRDVEPAPSNVAQFSIKYVDADGNEQYAVQNYENKASGSGYAAEVSIVLDEAIYAQSITICEFTATAPSWNNVSIVDMEAYSNELAAGAVSSLDDAVELLENAGGTTIGKNVTTFTLPTIEGYTVELNGADFEQIIGDDLTVVHPLTDKEVQVSYVVTDAAGASAKTADIEYVVEGLYTQSEENNSKPVIIPEIAEWYSDTTDQLAVEDLKYVAYDDEALADIVDEFIADYEDFTGVKLEKTESDSTKGIIRFALEAPDALLGEEGYVMDIHSDGISVSSESVTGNMYGMQTILQMYKQNAESFSIGTVRDYPRFETRGLLLDIARKPIGMDMINEIARTMRYYKMNDFQLHLSDNYIFLENYGKGANENEAFKAYEAFRLESSLTNEAGESPTAKDYYITKADMQEFIQSQRALGMKIVPEIDMPAHATSFTKIWPELMVVNQVSPLNSNRPLVDHFDVSKPEAIDKIKEIFDEYTTGENPTFDAETTVHVGADEFVANYTAYRQFANQIVPHVKETNTVRMWGGFTWLDDGVTEIIPEAIENVEMNLWSSDWADGKDMYDMGYKLINTIDDYGYMVPNGSMARSNAYGDLLNISRIFNSFAANRVKSRSGYVVLPSGDDQVLGAAFAIWSDNIDKSASGLSESDYFYRFFDALPFYAEKTWAATGQEKGSADALMALAQEQGTGPNTNPYYQEDKTGDTYESYDFENGLEDGSENDRDLTEGTAKVEDGALVLSGDNSYVTSPIERLGNGNEVSFDITLTEIAEPGDIIFEATPEYGTHDIRIMEDGRLGFTRELYNFYFDYVLPVGKTVNIKIVAQQQDTMLYVDGDLIGEATGKFIHNDIEKKTGIAHTTFALPLERIGSETNAVAAVIDNVVVKEAEPVVDIYNKAAWTGTTDTETVYNETEGLLRYAFDNNSSTIWHSNWQGTSDKLTGSNSFYAEIDFGQAYTINQFSFTPRTPQASGYVTKADLYIKENAEDEWTLVAEDAVFAADATEKIFMFEEQDVRYVKFVAKASSDGWVAVSEFDIANKPQRTCTVYVQTEGNGTVSGAGEVVSGTEVTITATPAEGEEFLGWYNSLGALVTNEMEYTFVGTDNIALIAKFTDNTSVVPEPPVFSDVTEKDYFYEAVNWAVTEGVTAGYFEDLFAPNLACSRAQVVTFLWRANGSPEPEGTEVTFKDVPEDAYYRKAVLWATENGITSGYNSEVFGSEDDVTRAQFVSFLYRAEGRPAYDFENPFSDVPEKEYYYDAVLWAVENGVTAGYYDDLFAPDLACTRAQVVSFLYRAEK